MPTYYQDGVSEWHWRHTQDLMGRCNHGRHDLFTLARAMIPVHSVESLFALGLAGLSYWRISKYLKTR